MPEKSKTWEHSVLRYAVDEAQGCKALLTVGASQILALFVYRARQAMYSKYSRKERTQAYLYGKGKMHTSTIKPAFPVSRLSLESLSLFLSLLLSWHDFFKTRRRCELQITQQVKCNCDVILSPIWEFLKMGVPQNHRFQYLNGLILDDLGVPLF